MSVGKRQQKRAEHERFIAEMLNPRYSNTPRGLVRLLKRAKAGRPCKVNEKQAMVATPILPPRTLPEPPEWQKPVLDKIARQRAAPPDEVQRYLVNRTVAVVRARQERQAARELRAAERERRKLLPRVNPWDRPEHRAKMLAIMSNPAFGEKIRAGRGHTGQRKAKTKGVGRWSAEHRARLKAAHSTPEFKAKMKARNANPEYRKKIAEKQRKAWSDPKYHANMVEKRRATMSKLDVKAKISGTMRQRWADPKFRAKMAKGPETRAKMSAAAKAREKRRREAHAA